MGQYRARNPVFRPQRALYEPAVSRRRTRGAAGAGRLRDELARDRCKGAVFQRRVACTALRAQPHERQPRLSAHGLSLSAAPSGENARPRPRSLVARVRYCSRKPARQSGLPLPHAGQDLGAAAQPLPLAARAYARADGRGGLPPFPPRTHEFLRLCDAHARVRGRRAHALARG